MTSPINIYHWWLNDSRERSTASGEWSARSAEIDPEPSEASLETPLKNKTWSEQTGYYYYGARSRRNFEHKPKRRSATLARPSPAFWRGYYNPKWSVPALSGVEGWLGVDPMAHKYPSMSPFVFTGNNPIMLVDPDGMQIDFSLMKQFDQFFGTGFTTQLLDELQTITGFNLQLDENNLLVITDADNQRGSHTARKLLADAIADPRVLKPYFRTSSGSMGSQINGQNILKLNPLECLAFKEGAEKGGAFNPLTMSIGMVFLHELDHTSLGSGFEHPAEYSKVPDPTIDLMNKIRKELGNEFGQRQGHSTFDSHFRSNHRFIPMKQGFLNLYQNGFDPKDEEAIFYDERNTRR